MRRVGFASILLAALAAPVAPVALAGPWQPDVVVQPPRHERRTAALTSVSHLIYLNDCRPNGCTVLPGFDDARTDHSSIPSAEAHLSAWGWGDAKWSALVQCAQDTFAPFNIQITTTDPGAATHFEVMIGGSSQQLDPSLNAGGVAPFVPCDGMLQDNVISFVFAGTTQSLNFLCGAVAQESSHVFGLDHEMNSLDPMTYLDLGSHKVFQYSDADCGEFEPRMCRCGATKQNSVRYLIDTFGPSNLPAPTMRIDKPGDDQWVKPGFAVAATGQSALSIASATMAIDDVQAATSTPVDVTSTWSFATPATVSTGNHKVTVSATDNGARPLSTSVNVHVMPTCTSGGSCPSPLHCLDGFCLPGADVFGGLGATCATNDDCLTGSCGNDGTSMFCTGACDSGRACPSGYSCTGDGDGLCVVSKDSGGCSTSGSGTSGCLMIGLGALVIALRRRRW